MDSFGRRHCLCRYHRLCTATAGRHRFIDVTTEGETLDKGEVFGTIEVVKTVSDLFLPIGGEILEVNPQLEEHPELVNQDPYGEGWIIKLKPTDASELDDLLDAEGYKEIINE